MCLRVEDLSIGEGSEYSQKTESEEGWEDLEPDTEEVAAQDLFNLASYHTVEELVQRTKEVWGVDLLKLKQDFRRWESHSLLHSRRPDSFHPFKTSTSWGL